MANTKKSAINQLVTRDYTIHMHKRLYGVSFKKRAPRAIKEIVAFAQKHMQTKDVRVDPSLNKEVWKQGIKSVPRRLRLRLSRKRSDEDDKALYTLVQAVDVANPKMETTTVEE